MERLDKILANTGYGTRKEVKKLIKNGAVTVDGEVAKNAEQKVDPYNSKIAVYDEPIEYKEFIYLMLNKPKDCVSATFDKRYMTVLDLVPFEYEHYDLFPIGRLDIDTEGLVILTNNGKLAHEILSPKNHIKKVYYAETEREINDEDIKAFESGMDLGDFTTMPAKLEKHGEGAIVTICEGKFHQVKRMFEKTGNRVSYLKRIKMGGVCLDENLPLGQMREMTEEEIQNIGGNEVL